MVISSRTPEGRPNRCPVCGSRLKIEPSDTTEDAPCPYCGHLLWFKWEDLGDVQAIKLTDSLLTPGSLDNLTGTLASGMERVLPSISATFSVSRVQF